jgi:nucleoid-associated protein EbfC
MFGKIGDMMGKLQEMKKRAEETKLRLRAIIIKTEGAGGDIILELNGNRELKSIRISDALQHGDKIELEKQLLLTFNKAMKEADQINEEEMKKAASGLLPGM